MPIDRSRSDKARVRGAADGTSTAAAAALPRSELQTRDSSRCPNQQAAAAIVKLPEAQAHQLKRHSVAPSARQGKTMAPATALRTCRRL